MNRHPAGSILYHVRRMLHRSASGVTDGQLLERFATQHDEAAFELLLWRHQRMVFSLCRRVLTDQHDAEDAFQATFLTLAHKAGSIRRRTSVAAWLHQVALRIALRLRSSTSKRAGQERADVERIQLEDDDSQRPDSQVARREMGTLLHEEINRLPEKYRVPVVLCYLEEKTCSEAAELLGWPRGTIATRLARGRELLRQRLTARGVTIPAAGLAAVLAQQEAFAVSETLVPFTIQTAKTITTSQLAPGVLSERVAGLIEGVLRDMFITKCKYVAVFSLAITLLVGAGGWLGLGPLTAQQPATIKKQDSQPQAKKTPPKTDKDKLQGTWVAESIMGSKLPPEMLSELFKLTFQGNKVTITELGNQREGTVRLDPKKTPKEIDFNISVKSGIRFGTVGIYELKGNRLKICRALGLGGPRPAKFVAGSQQECVIYRRQKNDEAGVEGRNPADVKRTQKSAQQPPATVQKEDNQPQAKKAPPKTDKDKLQGTWICETIEANKSFPSGIVPELFKLTFHGDKVTIAHLGKKKEATVRLDPKKTPKEMDWIINDKEGMVGVYELKGNRLKICFVDKRNPRPTRFHVTRTEGILHYRRQGKDGAGVKGRNPADVKRIQELAKELIKLHTEMQRLQARLEREKAINALLRARLKQRDGFFVGKLKKIDINKNTVSLILKDTTLEVPNIPFTIRAKFYLGNKECLITDIKPGMTAQLRLDMQNNRSVVTEIRAFKK